MISFVCYLIKLCYHNHLNNKTIKADRVNAKEAKLDQAPDDVVTSSSSSPPDTSPSAVQVAVTTVP